MAAAAGARASRGLIRGTLDINALLAFVFGLLFLSVMLIMAVYFPNPSPIMVKAFVTALALSAAGIGAVLPGYLEINNKGMFRAGGAIALFLVVWFSQPALEDAVINLKRPAASSEPLAQQMLSHFDRKDLAAAYALTDPLFKETVAFGQFTQLFDSVRAPLGTPSLRSLQNITPAVSPPGMPVGVYDILLFRSAFGAAGCRLEQVTLKATSELHWSVYGYQISPKVDC